MRHAESTLIIFTLMILFMRTFTLMHAVPIIFGCTDMDTSSTVHEQNESLRKRGFQDGEDEGGPTPCFRDSKRMKRSS